MSLSLWRMKVIKTKTNLVGESNNACFGIFMHCILFLQQRQHLFEGNARIEVSTDTLFLIHCLPGSAVLPST